MDKWRACWLFVDALKQVTLSHIIARKLDSYLLDFKQRNCQSESVIIFWENSGDPLSDLQKTQYRLLSVCETFCFAAVPTYRFTSTQYNSNSVQYAAVSQPDMNELAATKFPVSSANELQTDDCTTAGRITERIVRWCSSVIIQLQHMYLRHLSVNVSQ